LVDLERSEVVDLLPTRSAKALGEWLAKHPEVMVVSRDRQGSYAEGTRCAAPEPWSNGPVEGHINRLKTLKRQMYGRAGVELLRARLLPDTFVIPQASHQT
jgi:transposase